MRIVVFALLFALLLTGCPSPTSVPQRTPDDSMIAFIAKVNPIKIRWVAADIPYEPPTEEDQVGAFLATMSITIDPLPEEGEVLKARDVEEYVFIPFHKTDEASMSLESMPHYLATVWYKMPKITAKSSSSFTLEALVFFWPGPSTTGTFYLR